MQPDVVSLTPIPDTPADYVRKVLLAGSPGFCGRNPALRLKEGGRN